MSNTLAELHQECRRIGDILIIHFGDYNEIAQQATVIARVFDGTRPDMIYLTTDFVKGGQDD